MEKEYLYVGFYIDENNNYILKVGTTNNLKRRQADHNRTYRTAKHNRMAENSSFNYLWTLPLSKYNTLRYEDKTKEMWQELNIGEFIRNDRFILFDIPQYVEVKIKKTYKIALI